MSGKIFVLFNLLPIIYPNFKNKSWNVLISRGNKLLLIPAIVDPIPIQKLSSERAIARKNASLQSIFLEWSKSEFVGFRIIWIVIPKNFIKKQKIFSSLIFSLKLKFSLLQLSTLFFFKAWKVMKNPIKIIIKLPITLVILLDKKLLIQLPNHIEKVVIIIEILNKIIFATYEILVFFKPYVIPIPSESTLLEIARRKEFKIILKHLTI